MNPSVLAQQLQQAVNDYLRFSFETTTPFFDGLVERFIVTPGLLLKVPYLSIGATTDLYSHRPCFC